MLFSPRARRCGTLPKSSVGDGLTGDPISNSVVCVVTVVLKGCLGSVVASRVAVSRLDGCCVNEASY